MACKVAVWQSDDIFENEGN